MAEYKSIVEYIIDDVKRYDREKKEKIEKERKDNYRETRIEETNAERKQREFWEEVDDDYYDDDDEDNSYTPSSSQPIRATQTGSSSSGQSPLLGGLEFLGTVLIGSIFPGLLFGFIGYMVGLFFESFALAEFLFFAAAIASGLYVASQ